MKKKETAEMIARKNKEWGGTRPLDATFLRDNLHCLNGREMEVLRLRFGLDDGQTHTLREIGEELGVTPERIRQIEAKAWRKLRVRKLHIQRLSSGGESN